jgi:hypothetical protein
MTTDEQYEAECRDRGDDGALPRVSDGLAGLRRSRVSAYDGDAVPAGG